MEAWAQLLNWQTEIWICEGSYRVFKDTVVVSFFNLHTCAVDLLYKHKITLVVMWYTVYIHRKGTKWPNNLIIAMLASANSANDVRFIYEKRNFFLVSLQYAFFILQYVCYSVLRFQVLLFVPASVKVCDCSDGSSLAPFHSETDLRRASGALSERSVLHPGPRTVFGGLSEIWGPWRDSSQNGSSLSPYAHYRMIQHTF